MAIDFLAFIEERAKENNIYLVGVFIIENVEVRLIENDSRKYRDIVGLWAVLQLWTRALLRVVLKGDRPSTNPARR